MRAAGRTLTVHELLVELGYVPDATHNETLLGILNTPVTFVDGYGNSHDVAEVELTATGLVLRAHGTYRSLRPGALVAVEVA